ncbi:MAG TPA: hypothetical protein VGG13_03570 [Candidatus Saccharimonadales bacterium]|jgi:hypothetical protein
MAEAYRFSPIHDTLTFHEALGYIATQGMALATKVFGHELAVDTLTIFSHTDQEHRFLDRLVRRYGPVSSFSHGQTLYINPRPDLEVAGNHIKYLGLRAPDDPVKPQVGYVDYPVTDYNAIHAANHPRVHEITSGRGQGLLEVRHPDFDVLGYVVREEEHND